VRESVFSSLGDVSEARVLDLFAGSGALGIEAVSRGAESLVSVDRSARVIAAIAADVSRLGIEDRIRTLHAEARTAIRRLAAENVVFDLIFIDPPYDDFEQLGPLLELLVEAELIALAGVVVVESAKRHAVPPVPGLGVEQTRSYGDTSITWLVRSDGPRIGEARTHT
jgi:16S rRNA (guanine966-N2)-methyltransferase